MWTKYSANLFIKSNQKEKNLVVIHSSEISPEDKLNRRYLAEILYGFIQR